MIKVWISALILALATPALGQDLQSVSTAYLDEVLTASRAQAQLGNRETAPAFLDLTGDDQRWMNPVIKPGIGKLLWHMALFGAESFTVGEPQLAQDAARVPATMKYRETPGVEWPITVDYIRIHGKWKLRAMRLLQRRPLATDAGPQTVVRAWLSDLNAAAQRRNKLADNSWLYENLNRYWGTGAGYWRRDEDCSLSQRAACLTARASAGVFWAAAVLKREKTIRLEDFSMTPDGPLGTIIVQTPRRTTISQQRFTVRLTKDRRYGWQIARLERLDATTEPDIPQVSADTSSGENLVRSLLEITMGPDAPPAGRLLAKPDMLLPYFTDTREGRKAMAQFLSMSTMLAAIGAEPSLAVIDDLGNGRLRLGFEGSRLSTFSPVLTVVETGQGARIAGFQNR